MVMNSHEKADEGAILRENIVDQLLAKFVLFQKSQKGDPVAALKKQLEEKEMAMNDGNAVHFMVWRSCFGNISNNRQFFLWLHSL